MLTIADTQFSSRLLTGTGKFSHPQAMIEALHASGTELVTLALRRLEPEHSDHIFQPLSQAGYRLLPNTSGARSAAEAVQAARLAREALGTSWLKLEIHPDPRWLMPDPVETLAAAEQLVRDGFVVLPYVHADPVLCKRLEEGGCAAVMPLGAPIGSNRGLETRAFLDIIIERHCSRSGGDGGGLCSGGRSRARGLSGRAGRSRSWRRRLQSIDRFPGGRR